MRNIAIEGNPILRLPLLSLTKKYGAHKKNGIASAIRQNSVIVGRKPAVLPFICGGKSDKKVPPALLHSAILHYAARRTASAASLCCFAYPTSYRNSQLRTRLNKIE